MSVPSDCSVPFADGQLYVAGFHDYTFGFLLVDSAHCWIFDVEWHPQLQAYVQQRRLVPTNNLLIEPTRRIVLLLSVAESHRASLSDFINIQKDDLPKDLSLLESGTPVSLSYVTDLARALERVGFIQLWSVPAFVTETQYAMGAAVENLGKRQGILYGKYNYCWATPTNALGLIFD